MKHPVLTSICLLFYCISFGQGPTQDWQLQNGSGSSDYSRAVVTDSNSNIYILGAFSGTVDFNPSPSNSFNLSSAGNIDVYVQKLDSNKNFIWAKRFGGPNLDFGYSMDIDRHGNLLIVGTFRDSINFNSNYLRATGSTETFILKLDNQGNFVWANKFTGSSNSNSTPTSISVDDSNSVYISGFGTDTIDLNPSQGGNSFVSNALGETFIVKLDSNGAFRWKNNFGGNGQDQIRDIKIDVAGNVFFTGWFMSSSVNFATTQGTQNLTTNNSAAITGMLNNQGNFVWVNQTLDSNSNARANAFGLALDRWGSVYVVGNFSDSVIFNGSGNQFFLASQGNYDGFIQKISSTGQNIWIKQFRSTTSCYLSDVHTDDISVYLGGWFRNILDADPSIIDSNLIRSIDSDDVFIVKLDSNGNFNWATQAGGSDIDRLHSLTTDRQHNIIMAGDFTQDISQVPGMINTPLTSSGNSDAFVIKIRQPIATTIAESITLNPSSLLYPNPAIERVNVRGVGKNAIIKFFNIAGQLVLEPNTQSNISLESLESGVYFVQIEENGTVQTKKLIKQ